MSVLSSKSLFIAAAYQIELTLLVVDGMEVYGS